MSFNGIISEIPDISVDHFIPIKKAYFLSHCHTDHMNGLSTLAKKLKSIQPSAKPLVYMSKESAQIVVKTVDANLNQFIKILNPGKTDITLPGYEEPSFVVTLIPTDHCIGAAMFLFETPAKTILYTGDFRVSPDQTNNIPYLNKDGIPILIHVMYVDTTFQDLEYEYFPTRPQSIDVVTKVIEDWLKVDNNRVALVPSANWGYEYAVNGIYERMGSKVGVQNETWNIYRLYPDQLPGATNEDSKVHLCTPPVRKSKNKDNIEMLKKCCFEHNPDNGTILTIRLSALSFKNFKPSDHVSQVGNEMRVCYSTHCSSSELRYFVEHFAPLKTVGFEKPYIHVKVEDESGFVDDSLTDVSLTDGPNENNIQTKLKEENNITSDESSDLLKGINGINLI